MYGLLRKKNIVQKIAPVFILLGLTLSLVLTHPVTVSAAPGGTNTVGTNSSNTPSTGSSTTTSTSQTNDSDITCAIEKMGWILCPIIETSGKIGDQAFSFLANTFLQTEPELLSNSPSGTKAAWELARNLANIMFIIAFLVIILSQVTGQGLNNYGVKKMLPRLIIAAIAVNISYYICQLLVDLTNVLGFEIQRFLVNTSVDVSNKAVLPVQTGFMDNQTSGGALGKMATGILAAVGAIWFLLPMLFLGVGTVVITCLVIIVILLLRKAFIVLLVVVSPIAFVAYILPNTEKLFQKWGRMFWQLLLVFPIVAMLFGGGQLASAIILVAGSNGDTYKDAQTDNGGNCIQLPASQKIEGNVLSGTNNGAVAASKANKNPAEVKKCAQGSTPFLLGLVAAGIAVAPMLAVWAVLKGALSAAGAIGGKISGAVQNVGNKSQQRAKALEDGMRKAASQQYQARALNGGWVPGRRLVGMNQRRKMNAELRENKLKAAQAGFGLTGRAGNIAQQNISAQQAINAANVQQMTNYARTAANAADGLSGPAAAYLGSGNKAAAESLDAQVSKALAEAVRDAELHIDTSDLKKVGDDLASAVSRGDKVNARALQNTLLRSGSAGMKEFHSAIRTAESAGADVSDLRSNIRANFGSIKSSDPSLMGWATDQNQASLNSHFSNPGTWSGLNAAEFAGLASHSQEQAVSRLSQRTLNDLAQASNAQLLAQVKGNARTMLGSMDSRFR